MFRNAALIAVLIVTVFAFPTSVEAVSTSYNNDCYGDNLATFSWNDPMGIDYYGTFEGGNIHQSPPPESTVSVTVTIKCKVDGFNLGDIHPNCGTSDPDDGIPTKCIKFWMWYYVPMSVLDADPNPPAEVSCGNAFVQGAGSTSLSPYWTSARGWGTSGSYYRAMCEYFCVQNTGPCTMGASLTVTTSASGTFDWQAPDNANPGTEFTSTFKAGSRNWYNPSTGTTATGKEQTKTHTTCQAGHALLASLC